MRRLDQNIQAEWFNWHATSYTPALSSYYENTEALGYILRADVMSQSGESSSTQATASTEDDWSSVQDPNERRKIQNRIAQRKFREKVRQQREEAERNAENQRNAAGSYTTPEPENIEEATAEEGLPWGGISMRHVIDTGRAKEQSSRETSLYAAASRAGGSSRLGLHLIDNYARGSPAWAAWRNRFAVFHTYRAAQASQQAPYAARAQQRSWSLATVSIPDQ